MVAQVQKLRSTARLTRSLTRSLGPLSISAADARLSPPSTTWMWISKLTPTPLARSLAPRRRLPLASLAMASSSSASTSKPPRSLLVGVGGPTCGGKTTLAKHLVSLLHDSGAKSLIVHQDDFCPPESSLVWNERVGSADWDDPDTSVDWPRLRRAVSYVKEHGEVPEGHTSHDALNVQRETSVAAEVKAKYGGKLKEAVARDSTGGDLVVVFLDGFLLYHDEEVRNQMDARIFLRIGKELLRQRREARGGYVTAEGDTWKVSEGARYPNLLLLTTRPLSRSQDPPLYFDEILWPSHLKAHARLFQNGDVGSGQTNEGARDIHVIEGQDPPGKGKPTSLDDVVAEGCEVLLRALEGAR